MTTFARLAVPLYAVATVALWFVSRPPGVSRWRLASVSALVAAGIALVANQAIAHVWDRPRPFATHPLATHLFAAPSTDPSFPSDHAAAAFAIAVAILAVSRAVGAGFVAAATLIALSRVAVGLHYPSDVLAGAVVGAAAALFVTHLGMRAVDLAVRLGSAVTDPLLLRIRRAPPRAN